LEDYTSTPFMGGGTIFPKIYFRVIQGIIPPKLTK